MTSKRALAPPPKVPLPRINSKDPELRRVQKFVEQATDKSRKDQHSKGVEVRIKPTGAGFYTFAHRLGRKPNAIRVNKQRTAVSLFYLVSANSRTATIDVSGAFTADVWVY